MATDEQLIEALRRADAAGNAEDAQKIAGILKQQRAASPSANDSDFARLVSGQPKPKRLSGQPSFIRSSDVAGNIANQATFGFGDEISAAGVAAVGGGVLGAVDAVKERDFSAIPRRIGKEFKDIRADQRERRQTFAEERPVTSIASDIAGGVAGGGKAIGFLDRGADALRIGRAGSGLRASAIGAAEGAAFAGGNAEGNPIERVDDAAGGAAFGAVLGPAIQKLANGVQAFWRARRGNRVADEASKRAFKIMKKALAEDKGSNGKAEAFLRKWVADGADPDALINELGPTGQEIAREVASRKPTPALEAINRFKDAQGETIGDALKESFKGAKTVKTTRKTLQAVRDAQAAPLYEEAFAVKIDTNELADLARSRPALMSAMKSAARKVTNRGGAQRITDGDQLSMELLDRAKRELDDRISVHLRQGRKADAGDLIELRNEFVSRIDELNPKYAQAREIFAGTKEIDNALDLGRSFLKRNYTADQLADDLARMGPSEREFHRVAVAEEFEALVDRTRDVSNKASFVSTKAMRDKIKVLFQDSPDEGKAFIELIKKSEERFQARSFIDPRGGSQTQPRQRAKQIFENEVRGPVTRATQTVTGDPLKAPGKAVDAGLKALRGSKADKISDVLSRALFEGADDPFATKVPFRQVDAAGPINPLLQPSE